MATRFRYPTGVRPLLVAEAARRRRLETRLVSMLERAGFEEVLLPMIDYVEPYATLLDRDSSRQSYRFVDREGDLVSIRSDFTPMVARAVAPAISTDDLPLRVFYRGDVIRCEASRLGVNREIFQIGAELIGDASVEADVDLLMLAASCLAAFGVTPLVVYSDASIARTLLDAASTTAARGAIRIALLSKRATELDGVGDEIPATARALVTRLATGTATLDDVAAYEPCADAARRLRRIGEAVADAQGADFVLQLDDVEEAASYYTGIRFRIYGDDSRTKLAQGGRYDALYGSFGTSAPAIGFTFTVDDLAEDVTQSNEPDTACAVPAGEVPAEVRR